MATNGAKTPGVLEPCALVIFGATGDLAKRKLMPALSSLYVQHRLPERWFIAGTARSQISHEEFRNLMREAVREFARGGLSDPKAWDRFAANLYYVPANYREPESYLRKKEALFQLERKYDTGGRRVFYLAIPPHHYTPGVQQLAVARPARRTPPAGGRGRGPIREPVGTHP